MVDLLSEHIAALAGVSTRNYQHAALEAVGEVAARLIRKSTVSASIRLSLRLCFARPTSRSSPWTLHS